MNDFNLDRSSQDDSDQPMEDVYSHELEYEPEPERQPAFRQDLMPSVEGTASIIESSPTQINSESESSSASQVRSEELDAMDLSYDNSPNAERQQSMVAGSSADDRVTPSDIPGDQRIPSNTAPQIRPNSLAASSLTPIIATTSIFGSPTHPSQPPIISSPTPSIISVNNGTSAPSLVDNQNSTRTPSMLGGPVQQSSTYKPIQPEAHVEEDDNDIMIIDPREASLAAQQKWSSHTPHTVQNDDVVFIKQETREEAPDIPTPTPPPARMSAPPPKKPVDPARMVAAQRAMMQRNKAQNARNNGEGSSRASVYSEPPLNFDRYENETFGNTGHVDPIMGCVDEDNSWMDEEDDGDEVYDSWVKLRNMLLRKQRSKTIKPDEAMSLFKVKQKIDTRDRLRAGTSREDAAGDEAPNSLFLPEKREETIARHRRDCPRQYESEDDGDNAREDHRDNSVEVHGVDNGNGEYDDDEAMAHILAENDTPEAEPDLGLTKAGKPRKRRAKAAKGPREYMQRQEEQRREKERAKAQKKKARQPNASPVAARGKGKGKDSGKGRGKAKEKGKASKKGKGKEVVTNGQSLLASGKFRSFGGDDAVGHMMLEDMMNNDPITDRLQNPIFDRPEEEVMVGNQTKTTQFQRLFANIPEPEDAFTRGAVRSDKAKLRDASKSFGYAKCKAVDGKWLIKGMKSPLWHHQLLGAKWMVQRELSSQAPHGGILGDSMGLGKTVQTLACMVGNPPGPEDIKRKVKATLIVCPSSITKQWVEEIGTHVEGTFFPKILHYNTSSEISLAILEDTDIVVTSYSTVMKQFPFPDREGRLEIARNGYPAWCKDALENMGMLHRVNWFRVVLDEAQHIKNNHARTSLACQNLKSVYRWCLTGTPLLNRLEELFPYLRFLKANYSMDWSTFQKYFCDPDAKDCNNRIATLLSYTMMRRTMKTTILNRPIIKLPKPHPKIVYLQFSPEEAIIYRITENRFRNNLNAFFKKGDASRNYGVFMVQLLRLRQCTSHPFMLERTIKESWTMEDVQELRVRLAKLQQLDRPFYEQCKLWVETSEASRAEARDRGEDLPDDEMLPFGQSSYGHTFDMDRALKTLNETELYERVTCSLCSDVPIEPLKTDCGHIFCKDCIETFVAQLVVQDNDYLTCPECNQMFETMEKVPLPYLEPQTYSNSRRSKSKSKAKTNGKGKEREISQDQGDGIVNFSKGRDLMGFEPVTNDSSWLTKSDRDEGFPLTPSTKTTALKALLLKGFEEAPLDKVVIYVQFRTLARIVGRICNGEGWGFLYLTGDSSLEHRDRAIKRFRDDDDVKILIAGLKCGGLGLNFPWANRCISLDLWWNHAVEQQAFGRIFRIKQEKETYMTRIVVRNTVDMRMLSMQLHKLQNLQKAMSDENTKERSSLSLKQLANLFGFLRTDGDGEILSVEPDYESEDDSREGGNGGSSGGRDVGAGDFAGVGAGRGHGEGWGGPNRRRGMSVERETLDSDNVEADGYGNSGGYGNVMEVEDPDEDI
ncbi:SNF2 family N-terminal domain-containing protein [Rhexocercosporidium sp. MPI-PUGE-AT-0058]|nr:SNF2 family N-terminal domain-containing protein [Rhexocercosporidium sp. MPI-PUGE-AT-0058]